MANRVHYQGEKLQAADGATITITKIENGVFTLKRDDTGEMMEMSQSELDAGLDAVAAAAGGSGTGSGAAIAIGAAALLGLILVFRKK